MKTNDFSAEIAANMNMLMKDAEFNKIFSGYSIQKQASVPVEELEVEIELPLKTTAASEDRGDCVCCGKKRANWDESKGVCKCSSSGCSPMGGCKEGCSCDCTKKEASMSSGSLIKQAFQALIAASTHLDNADCGNLSAQALLLANDLLIVEAKKKTDPKAEKAKLLKEKIRAKEKAAREKEQQDKNDVRDKASKAKEKEKLQKLKDKEQKDRNAAKDKASKDKNMKEKMRLMREKANKKK